MWPDRSLTGILTELLYIWWYGLLLYAILSKPVGALAREIARLYHGKR